MGKNGDGSIFKNRTVPILTSTICETISNQLKTLDSRFHGNDIKWTFETFCEFVRIGCHFYLCEFYYTSAAPPALFIPCGFSGKKDFPSRDYSLIPISIPTGSISAAGRPLKHLPGKNICKSNGALIILWRLFYGALSSKNRSGATGATKFVLDAPRR